MIFESMMITGGMGQIGSYIAEQAIEENYAKKIVIYDNLTSNKISSPPNGSILVEGDILDKDSLNKCLKDHKVEAIIHCAAQIFVTNSIKDPIHDAEINIMGTLNLLNGANQNNIQHLVTIGSAAVIGHPKLIPIPPSTQKDPLSPYGISKATAELYTIKFAKLFNKNFNVVRPFNVYSPRIKKGDPYAGVIVRFIELLNENKQIQIEGDGLQTRDFIHAKDVAKITLNCISSNYCGEIVNASTGIETSILELSQILSRLFEVENRIEYLPARIGDIKRSCGIKPSFFDFTPIHLDEGLSSLILK